MDRFVITGGARLHGECCVNGAKNAVLPILAACLMSKGVCVLHNVPYLNDVSVMIDLLGCFGVKTERQGQTLVVDSRLAVPAVLDENKTKRMRASNLLLGASLSAFKEACLPYPGGCEIGARPMNYHLQALSILGTDIADVGGYIEATATKLKGAEICFDFPSVGATENVMLAAVKCDGVTVIRNAAREPELVDLAEFLNAMGAKISGAGTDTVIIHGVERLQGAEYRVMPDRIETGTLLCAAAMTNGDVFLRGAQEKYQNALLSKLRDAGAKLFCSEDGIRIRCSERLHAVDVQTMPYPGFPTDMQPQFMALMTLASETSIIMENVFENRFKHVAYLNRMGADIKIIGRAAVVNGAPYLRGAAVCATDLRAGAALICAGLAALGTTTISGVEYIDRGYQHLEGTLNALGADIVRITDNISDNFAVATLPDVNQITL